MRTSDINAKQLDKEGRITMNITEDAYYRNARDKYRASMELSDDEIKIRYKAKKLLTILTPLEVATVVIKLSEELTKIQKG